MLSNVNKEDIVLTMLAIGATVSDISRNSELGFTNVKYCSNFIINTKRKYNLSNDLNGLKRLITELGYNGVKIEEDITQIAFTPAEDDIINNIELHYYNYNKSRHIKSILNKLGLSRKIQLASYYYQNKVY